MNHSMRNISYSSEISKYQKIVQLDPYYNIPFYNYKLTETIVNISLM